MMTMYLDDLFFCTLLVDGTLRQEEHLILGNLRFTKQAMEQQGVSGYKRPLSLDFGALEKGLKQF